MSLLCSTASPGFPSPPGQCPEHRRGRKALSVGLFTRLCPCASFSFHVPPLTPPALLVPDIRQLCFCIRIFSFLFSGCPVHSKLASLASAHFFMASGPRRDQSFPVSLERRDRRFLVFVPRQTLVFCGLTVNDQLSLSVPGSYFTYLFKKSLPEDMFLLILEREEARGRERRETSAAPSPSSRTQSW